MVWLPVFGSFNEHTDINSCDFTQGLHGHRQRVCTKADSGRKIPCHTGTPTSISIAPQLSNQTIYQLSYSHPRAGIAQWLEPRTRDWKVAGSNPCRSSVRIFFSRVDFLCWLLFWYSLHPRVTAVARKRSWSCCQKCRWQVTAKTCIHHTYVALHEVTWSMVVWCPQNLYWDGSSFMWYQPCQRLSTPLRWIFKNML